MDYPQPIGITDIFNPAQFPQTFSLLEQILIIANGRFLQYPVAQGSQTWEEGGFTFVLGAEGLTYNGTTTTWANLQTKIEAIQALSQASNSTTLNVDNSIQIQNGETVDNPTQYIKISADASGNRISLDGSYGEVGQVLTSGGENGSLSWGEGGGGGSQNLQEVCDISNVLLDTDIILNNSALTTAILSATGLNIIVPDPADPLDTVSVATMGEQLLQYSDVNTPINHSVMSSGGFSINVNDPLNEGQPFTTVSIDSSNFTMGNPENQTETNTINPQGVSISITDTGTGDINSAQVSTNGFGISLTNYDSPENPEPSNVIDITSISIKTDQQDRDDSQTTILGQHSLNYSQVLNQESKDILQMNGNYLKIYDITTQTEMVNLQNVDNLFGSLVLSSTENVNKTTLSNTALVFSADDGDNWIINQSTDGSNNLTITQTGTAGYLDLNFNELLIRGGAGNSGQVLTSGGANGNFTWTTVGGGGGWVGTASSNLNMDTYDITSSSGTLDLSATNIQITGQANFISPPHLPTPILGNDGATKGYVDSLVGQYSGGFNLFLNQSQTDPTFTTFKELTPLVDSASTISVPISLTTNSPFLLSQFITLPLGISEIPIGLWDLLLYALVDTATDSTNTYFELWKRMPVGADVLLGTSGLSGDINNTTNSTSYSMSLTISTAIPLQLSDRVYIKIYGQTTHNNTVVLTTYYEGVSYSFLQTTLNAGTTLLSSNNNWTGTNNFELNPTTPSKLSPANTDIINYEDIQRLSTPIVSTLDYYITTDSPFFQYPPAPPTNTLLQTYQYYGWYFINAVIARKIDWFFAPDFNMTVADVKGLYMNYLNITTTSNDDLPFITIYTKPTGVNDYYPSFAHSSATYIANFTPASATPYCSFMNISGTQQDPFPYGHTLGSMILSPVAPNPRGEYLGTEQVLAVSVGTNSGSSLNQVNFIMSKVGICLEQGNQELILNPQNIIAPTVPTLTQVLSSGNSAGSTSLNMNSQSISSVNNLSATSITTPSIANGSATMTVGTVGQITNILGTLQNNGSALPAYISASGVSSGIINMGNFGIINSGGLDASGTPVAIGQASASLGVSIGRATQSTNLNGNLLINSSAGTSGQFLTSAGSGNPATWTTPVVSLSPSVQNNATASAISMSVGITRCRSLDITIVSGAKYLISGSFVCYSSGSAPQQNTTLVYMGIGQQAQTASPSVAQTIPITTNTGFMNSPFMNEETCLSCVQFQNYPAEQYTLANSYVWTAPASANGSRTFSLCARAGGTITTSIILVNYTFSVTRIV